MVKKQTEAESDLIARLADEFAERYRRGERPPISEYVAKCPELEKEIREVLDAAVRLEQLSPLEENASSSLGALATGPPMPAQLGDFHVIREIGRGGMGIVYLAEQQSLGRRVALKVLPQQMLLDSNRKSRFTHEAKVAARLHHTNIVPVFGVGHQDGLSYYAMQYIEGLGLDEVLAELRRIDIVATTDGTGGKRFGHEPAAASPVADASVSEVTRSLVTRSLDPTRLVERGPSGVSRHKRVADAPEGPPADEASGDATNRDTVAGRLSDTHSLSARDVFSSHSGEIAHATSHKVSYWENVARIGVQVADALEHAHRLGILHRDVKPSNLLLDADGKVWVTDFGLAKSDDQHDLTRTGDVIGTLRYLAPEMFDGRATERSDVYSLGLTLYELAARRPAYQEADRRALVQKVMHESPPRLKTIQRDVPRDLETIITKSTDREPARRYQSAAELREDLNRYLRDDPILARRPSVLQRLGKLARRHRQLATVATVASVLLAVTTIVLLSVKNAQIRDEQAETEQAYRLAKERTRVARQAVRDLLDVMPHWAQRKRMLNSETDFLRRAIVLLESYVSEEGSGLEELADIGRAYSTLGTIHYFLQEGEEAESAYHTALRYEQRVLQRASDSAKYRLNLAATLSQLSTFLRDSDRHDEAEPFARRAIGLYEQLLDEADRIEGSEDYLAKAYGDYGAALNNLALARIRASRYGEAETLLKRAIERQERALELQPKSVERQVHLRKHHANLAHVYHYLGETQQASDALAKAVEVGNRLAEDYPTFPDFREEVAYLRESLARQYTELGRMEDAMATFRAADDIYRQLAFYFPGERSLFLLRRIRMLSRIGECLEDLGRYDEAGAVLENALALHKNNDLRGDTKRRPDAIELEAGALKALALLCKRLGKLEDAVDYNKRAVTLYQQLIATSLAGREARRDHAVTRLNLGTALSAQAERRGLKLHPEELEHTQIAATQLQKLVDEEPFNITFKWDLALALNNLGRVFYIQRDLQKAEETFQQSVKCYREVVQKLPGQEKYAFELARAENGLAMTLLARGESQQAASLLTSAIRTLERLAAEQPNRISYQTLLVKCLTTFGGTLVDNEPDRAAEMAKRCRAIYRDLHRDNPRDAALLKELAMHEANLALCYWRLGDLEQAQATFEASAGSFQKLIDEPDYQSDVPFDAIVPSYNLAIMLEQSDRGEEALAWLENTVVLLERIENQDPQNREVLGYLHSCYGRQHQILDKLGRTPEVEQVLRDAVDCFAALVRKQALPARIDMLADWEAKLALFLIGQDAIREGIDLLEECEGLYRRILAEADNQDEIRLKLIRVNWNLGIFYQVLGLLPRAEHALRQALELDPANEASVQRLAWFLANCPDQSLRNAEEAVQLAAATKPTIALHWTTLGAAYYRALRFDDALDALQHAVESESFDPYQFLFLAMAHWKSGHHDEAREWFSRSEKMLEQIADRLDGDVYFRTEISRLREEAAELLELEKSDLPVPGGGIAEQREDNTR